MLGPSAVKALARELQELQSAELHDLGIRVTINEADVTDIQAEIDGPPGTPFEGGMFRMRLSLPADFPASPPKGFFTTKIWHPNVSKSGEICVNVLKRDWKPELGGQEGQQYAVCNQCFALAVLLLLLLLLQCGITAVCQLLGTAVLTYMQLITLSAACCALGAGTS
jgi:hypothetical protein